MAWGERYRRGDFLRIDDRSGFRVYASQTQQEWTGRIVDKKRWESRQPQDFVKGVRDQQNVPQPRPRTEPPLFPGTQPCFWFYNDPNIGKSFILETPFGPGPYNTPSNFQAYLEILRGNGIANSTILGGITPPGPVVSAPVVTGNIFTLVEPDALDPIGTIVATNVDATAIWEIVAGDLAGNFTIVTDVDGQGTLAVSNIPPVVGDYTLLVKVTNDALLFAVGVVVIHVQPLLVPVVSNFTATFTLPTPPAVIAIPTSLGFMSATNPPVTWAITNGNGLGYFSINTSTGELNIASAALAVGVYMLTVKATNGDGSGFATATITVLPFIIPPPPSTDGVLFTDQSFVPILG